MKEKHKKRKKYSLIFKMSLCVVLLMITACFTCVLPVAAEASDDNEIMKANYEMIEKYSTLLGGEINIYTEKDSGADKALSKKVAEQVNLYRKQLLDLQSHDGVGKMSLEDDILLYHAKGKAAGRVAWIYYSNLPELNSVGSTEAKKTYEGHCQEIKEATSHAVLSAREDGMAAEANRTAFGEKIKALAKEDDSLASASLISGALERIKTVSDISSDGSALEEILQDTKNKLSVQRGRDGIEKELELLFGVIRPGEVYKDNSEVSLFAYKMKNESTLKGMNEVYRETLCALLRGESGSYTRLFINELSDKLSVAATAASDKGEHLYASPLFESYTVEKKRALTKDRIAELFAKEDKKLAELEVTFNKEGGLVDRADSTVKMNAELTRAEHAKKLYMSLENTKASLGVILGDHNKEKIMQRAEEFYNEAEKELFTLPASQSGFGESCKGIFESAEQSFLKLCDEGKAERFLLDYKDILSKEDVELSSADKNVLALAICDYCGFEDSVRGLLGSRINSICKKYNTVLSIEIRELMKEDSFYLDLCEEICGSLQKISLEDIEAYYIKAQLVKKKAEALVSGVEYYRALAKEPLYEVYTQSNKEALAQICTELSKKASEVPLDSSLDASLSILLKNAKISMDRLNQCVRVESAAAGSQNQKIGALVSEATEKINACNEKQEMLSIADKAVFKIKREISADEISKMREEIKQELSESKFLSDKEKEEYISTLSALAEKYRGDILLCENMTVLGFLFDTAQEKLLNIKEEASAVELKRGKEEYAKDFGEEIKKGENDISELLLLAEGKKQEYKKKLSEIHSDFSARAVSCASIKELEALYSECYSALAGIVQKAYRENLDIYKEKLMTELDRFLLLEGEYSKESFEKIKSLVAQGKNGFDTLTTIEECDSHFEKTKKAILEIGNKLYDAKKAGSEALDLLLAEALAVKGAYSEENLKKIKEIHAEAILAMKNFDSLSQLAALEEHIKNSTDSIKAIKKELLYTSDKAIGIEDKAPKYPADYNVQKDGYWASLWAPGGIDYGAVFYANAGKENSQELKKIQSIVREAARKKSVSASYEPTAAVLNMLKRGNVSLALDLTLEGNSSESGAYTVKILLPSGFEDKNIIGVVFVDDLGRVELCSTQRSGNLLSFETSHFSNYYIVTESNFDLMPFIRFLIGLLVVEVIVLAFVLLMRYLRKQRDDTKTDDGEDSGTEKKEGNDLPMPLSAFALLPLGAIKVTPQNGEIIALLLSITVLTLGCAVALLAQMETRAFFKRKERGEKLKISFPKRKRKQELPVLLLTHEDAVVKGENRLEEKRKREEESGEPLESFEQEELCPVYIESELSGEVQVMSDEGAYTYSENNMAIDEKDNYHDYDEGELRRAMNDFSLREEINIDEIAALFDKDEVVTPEMMKQKKLIKKRTEFVKVLARGNLTKPMKIKAHDFSRAAEEMLKTVGGEAIRIR